MATTLKPRLHDTTGCQTGCHTGLTAGLTTMLMCDFYESIIAVRTAIVITSLILGTDRVQACTR